MAQRSGSSVSSRSTVAQTEPGPARSFVGRVEGRENVRQIESKLSVLSVGHRYLRQVRRQFLGLTLKAASPDTKIMLGTMSNGDSGKDPAIVTAVLADATAKSFISLIGLQWGMSSTPAMAGAKASGLPMWQTEHKCGNYPWKPSDYQNFNATTAPNDLAYGSGELEISHALDQSGRHRIQRLEHGARHRGPR